MLMARSGVLAIHSLGCMWIADATDATAGDQCADDDGSWCALAPPASGATNKHVHVHKFLSSFHSLPTIGRFHHGRAWPLEVETSTVPVCDWNRAGRAGMKSSLGALSSACASRGGRGGVTPLGMLAGVPAVVDSDIGARVASAGGVRWLILARGASDGGLTLCPSPGSDRLRKTGVFVI